MSVSSTPLIRVGGVPDAFPVNPRGINMMYITLWVVQFQEEKCMHIDRASTPLLLGFVFGRRFDQPAIVALCVVVQMPACHSIFHNAWIRRPVWKGSGYLETGCKGSKIKGRNHFGDTPRCGGLWALCLNRWRRKWFRGVCFTPGAESIMLSISNINQQPQAIVKVLLV